MTVNAPSLTISLSYLYGKTGNRQRKRFTVAHELGHIMLGHVGHYELINREILPNDNPIEQELIKRLDKNFPQE